MLLSQADAIPDLIFSSFDQSFEPPLSSLLVSLTAPDPFFFFFLLFDVACLKGAPPASPKQTETFLHSLLYVLVRHKH